MTNDSNQAFSHYWHEFVKAKGWDAVTSEILRDVAELFWSKGCVFGELFMYRKVVESGFMPASPVVLAEFERILAK